jgi:prepilin-type N-terminal cleavage/methylation domain-containing protein
MGNLNRSVKSLKGFTLIELMVVIAIIAILATIGMVAYSQAQKVARDGKRIEDMQAAQRAIELYKATTNLYPAGVPPYNLPTASLNSYFQGGAAPVDPTGTNPYKYYLCDAAPNLNIKYVVCATLENPNGKANESGTVTDNSAACGFTYSASGTARYCITN